MSCFNNKKCWTAIHVLQILIWSVIKTLYMVRTRLSTVVLPEFSIKYLSSTGKLKACHFYVCKINRISLQATLYTRSWPVTRSTWNGMRFLIDHRDSRVCHIDVNVNYRCSRGLPENEGK